MGILLKHIFGLNKVFWSVRSSVGSSNNMNKLSSVGITKLVSKKVEGGGGGGGGRRTPHFPQWLHLALHAKMLNLGYILRWEEVHIKC
jgi:hypothetical protein